MTDSEKQATRKDLMRPAQMLGLAAIAAVFAGLVTAISLGAFFRPAQKINQTAAQYAAQQREITQHVLTYAPIVAGIVFIVVLLGISLMLLAVKPTDVAKTIDRPVMFEREERKFGSATDKPAASSGGAASNGGPVAGGDSVADSK